MSQYDFDYFVIGAGSGGVRTSRIAASHGAKVAVAEDSALGGTCVNVGCVPKKLMTYGAHFSHDCEDAHAYGWDVQKPTVQWSRFIENKNKEILRLNGIYERLLTNAGVTILRGRASFVDAHTVKVTSAEGEKLYTAKIITVAVGGWPFVPEIPGRELAITSNEAFYLPELPKRVCIVGGGYIAVEFAGIFHGYGSDVTLLYRSELWLRGFDDDLRTHLKSEYDKQGIKVLFNMNIDKLEKTGTGIMATFTDGSTHEYDIVMFATGRKPKTVGLGCEKAGINLDESGAIIVDEALKTSVDNIYAIGDVIDRIQLTPVALAEGHCLADTLFGGKPRKTDYSDIPTAVFSNPPLGTVGPTEEECRKRYGDVHIYRTSFRGMKHTLTQRDEKTLMKLIVHPETDKVLAVHMCGDAAGEVIQLVGVALKAGVTKAHFDSTIGVHPTAAEEFVTMRSRV
ncbi:hypothetical protein GUITHDRAFT_83774 [Guillardia theta CCMP2712]|uniref:Glutathione reductase n=1 Tax=Guillardia theta (strain CCMP2712) TaxID=905079 RepID=L1K4D3_GUITC|nr:hypothetical protein GUITHDRAFT_83774 [Guillardia theta CCMP2712]EKX55464.1 hypothetical protein GUITHDRAFT_83774 [Guillardia theta CCMP2712]|eukprot:XP_005842444.1 hypothetical protein GUITHDRAFT_83774 [Guillardia theta CCMP2712]